MTPSGRRIDEQAKAWAEPKGGSSALDQDAALRAAQAETNREHNRALFTELLGLGLPPRKFVIVGSGPLGIRGLRRIGDIDINVDEELFSRLASTHPSDNGRIQLTDHVEALSESAFPPAPGEPTVAEQIATADVICGLRFLNLELTVAMKLAKGRDKDHDDVATIYEFQAYQLDASTIFGDLDETAARPNSARPVD